MDSQHYSIGQVAEMLCIPSSTVRYYDAKGLLPNVERTQGGIRAFADEDIDWLRLIGHLKRSGMTLNEIRKFVELSRMGDDSIEQRRALVHSTRDKVMQELEELKETLDYITYKCWYYDTAAEAGTCAVPHNMNDEDMPPEMLKIKRKCEISSH